MESYKIGELVEVRADFTSCILHYSCISLLLVICMHFRQIEQMILKRKQGIGLMEMKTALGMILFSFFYHTILKT